MYLVICLFAYLFMWLCHKLCNLVLAIRYGWSASGNVTTAWQKVKLMTRQLWLNNKLICIVLIMENDTCPLIAILVLSGDHCCVAVTVCIYEPRVTCHQQLHQLSETVADHPPVWSMGSRWPRGILFAICHMDTCQLLQGSTFCDRMHSDLG